MLAKVDFSFIELYFSSTLYLIGSVFSIFFFSLGSLFLPQPSRVLGPTQGTHALDYLQPYWFYLSIALTSHVFSCCMHIVCTQFPCFKPGA